MKRVFFIIIFLHLFFVSEPQIKNKKEKDIETLLEKTKTLKGENLFKTILEIIDYYLQINSDSAKFWLEKNNTLIKEIKQPHLKSKFFKNYSYYNIKKGDFKNAIFYLKKAIEIEQKYNLEKELAESYRWLAGIFFKKGDIKKAIEQIYISLKIFTELNDYEGIIMCYSNIGLLEKQVGNYIQAINNFYKALNLAEKFKIKIDKSGIFTNMGITYRYLNKYDSSYFFLLKAAELSKNKNKINDLAHIYLNIAKLFIDLNNKDSVEYYFQLLSEIFNNIDITLQPTILTTMGKWYYKQENYNKAINFLKKAYEISKSLNSLNELEYSLFYLYKSYKLTNNYKEALKYLENLTDIQDSIRIEEAKVKIEELKQKYENEKQQVIIKQLKKDKQKAKIIKILLLTIIILFIAIFFFMIKNYKKQKKINKLEKEKILRDLEFKNKQLTSQALLIIQKNKLLNSILQSLNRLKYEKNLNKKEINQLTLKIKSGLQIEKDWELFRQYFEMVNKDFFTNLKNKFPELTPSELKLCALIKLHLNIKETAALLNISPNSVKNARHILRKKFGLNRNQSLYDFLSQF